MNKLYYISILLISLIVLSSPQTVFSQEERLAVVSTFNGEVRVQHDGVWKTVTKVGNRTRNSSVYNGDMVLTMPGSQVDLVFSDNTHLKVEEDTTLTISTRQITAEDRAKEGFVRNVAGTRQEVVRNINVKAGKLWANITPSKSVLTEFESPTGVASVRGTVLTFAFLGGTTAFNLINGLLDFISAVNNLGVNFDSGDALNISETESGQTQVVVTSGDIALTTSEVTVTVGDGGSLDLSVNPDTGEITVDSADNVTITTEDGTTTPVETGDGLGTVPSDNGAGAGEGADFGADVMGGGEGNDGGDSGDGGDGGDSGDGGDGQFPIPDPFLGTSPSQNNQSLLESSSNNNGGDTNTNTNDSSPPVMLDFTELPFGPVDGLSINGVNFEFKVDGIDSNDANYNSGGPGNTTYVQDPSIEGPTVGILTLIFDTPTALINFGLAMSTTLPASPGFTVSLFDASDVPIGGVMLVDIIPLLTFSEAMFNHVGTPVEKAVLTFDESIAPRFAFDNLYYSQSDKFFDDFSDGLGPWWTERQNTPYIDTSFGPIIAGSGNPSDTFAVIHTGMGDAADSGSLGMDFYYNSDANRQFKFDYNFVTTEFTESMPLNDYFVAEAHLSDGSTIQLAYEDAFTSNLTLVTGLPTGLGGVLDGSDGAPGTGGQTGWLTSDNTFFVPSGLTTLHFHVYDAGDDIVDSAVLIDNVLDPIVVGDTNIDADETPAPSTDYLLTFARAIGDIDSHDTDDPGVAVRNLDSIIHSDNDLAANLDAIRDSLVVVKEFMENHINDFGVAINHNEIKAQLDNLVAKVDAARENTGNISTLRNEIETVLASIMCDDMECCKENSVKCEHLHHL